MSQKLNGANEPSLVRLYMGLTGTSEAAARAVLMHVCSKEAEETSETIEGVMKVWREKKPLSVSEPVQRHVGWFEDKLASPLPA